MLTENRIEYIHLESVDSTNTWVKENASTLNQQALTCVFASEQTAGRGRFNRKWISPKGQSNNIYATLYFCLPLTASYIGNLSQILSLSCIHVLKFQQIYLQIKWPNDLFLEEKKIGGILCETLFFKDHIAIILGLGLNVELPLSLLNTLDQPAISLAQVDRQTWNRDQLLQQIVNQFAKDLEQLSEQGFTPFLSAYISHLTLKDKLIIHHDGNQTLEGFYESINEKGQMILRLQEGKKVAIFSGEILQKEV